jgi:hypothetical protein
MTTATPLITSSTGVTQLNARRLSLVTGCTAAFGFGFHAGHGTAATSPHGARNLVSQNGTAANTAPPSFESFG